MALSTAKMESAARDIGERLTERGFAISQSQTADSRSVIVNNGADALEILFQAKDAVSKDIFGNDSKAFTPHDVELHIATVDGGGGVIREIATGAEIAEVMMELASWGFALNLKVSRTAATPIGDADFTDGTIADNVKEHRVKWPTRGA